MESSVADKKLQRQIDAIKKAVAAAQARINAKRDALRKKLNAAGQNQAEVQQQLDELNALEHELTSALDKTAISIEIAGATASAIKKRARRM